MVRTCVSGGKITKLTSRRGWLLCAALALVPCIGGCLGSDRTSKQVCSDGGFCWQRPFPQGNALHSLSGLSSRYIWAVGEHGTIV